jgi:translocation and assembly module TamB
MITETKITKRTCWKRYILWGLAGLVALLLIVAAGVLLVNHSAGFRQRILAIAEGKVAESTGARLEVRDFHLALTTLSLDLYGITVQGSEPDSGSPLLRTAHINVGLKILSVVHSKWRLQDIVIDHPVLHVFVNKAGENNLPKTRQQSSGNTNIFDLAIQELAIHQGEIYYNDAKSALDAELRDVSLNGGFENAQSRYYGELGYSQGLIRYGTYAPLAHDLHASFNLTPSRFTLDRLDLAAGGSRFYLKATVDDYANNPKVEAGYDGLLVGEEVRRLLKNPSVPGGVVRISGSLRYQNDPQRPMLETVSLDGQLSSRELLVKTPSIQTVVRDLGARYKLEGGNAEVENVHAQILGGRLDGKLVITDLTGAAHGRLQASVKDISLQDAAAASGNKSSLQQAKLSGTFGANAEATWTKTLDTLVAHADAALQAAIGKSGASTPLQGAIHADYRNANGSLALYQSVIKTPQTSITVDGLVSTHSQLQVKMQAGDLHELEMLAANFKKPSAGGQSEELGLYGTAALNAAVSGSINNPQITGEFTANNLRVKGSSWRVLRADLSANPSMVRVSHGDLEAATQGRINFDLQAALKRWAYNPANPVQAQVSGSQISLAELERLAGQTYPLAGRLSLNLSVHGSQLNPEGNGDITLLNAKVADQPVTSVNLRFQGNGSAVNANLAVRLPAGDTRANLTYSPKDQTYKVQVQTTNLRLEKLQAVSARKLQINGGLNLHASGRGTLKSPELTATLQIPTLQVQKQTIRGVSLIVGVRDHRADINLDSEVAETYVKANGYVGIDAPYQANIRLDTGRVSFQPLVAIYMPAQQEAIKGQTEMHFTVGGPLQDKSRLEAHLEIPVLTAQYNQFQLAASKPIHLDYRNGVATLQPTGIQGTDTDIRMQGSVPINNLQAASYLVQGKIDLALLHAFAPDLQSSGQIQFDLDSKKFGAGGSNVEGQVRLVNGKVETLTSPLGVSNANGVITVTKQRMEITSFEAHMGGGVINLKGGVAYSPEVQFALAINAVNVRLRYPQGVRAVFGSALALSGTPQDALLNGQVRIEHVSFTPEFDLSTFMGQFTGESSPPPTPGLAQNIKLNINVQSTSSMNLTSSEVSLQGNAILRVVGTAADPVILGRANLTGGDLFLANRRYVIQNGTVNFVNPVTTQPVVNAQVATTVNDYNINLHFQGTMDRLQTTYTSDPPLPPVDIINLLAFGQTTEAQAANPSPTGVAGGEALLAQGVSGQVSSKLAKVAGISSLSIDPGLGSGSNQSNPGARIAVQQRVSGNLFVTFATDVTSTQDQQIEVQYNLNPRWSMAAVRDQNGGIGVDAKYRKTF